MGMIQLQLLQWGEALGRVLPELQKGQHVRTLFKVGLTQKTVGWWH
jgi:hypothetical protein